MFYVYLYLFTVIFSELILLYLTSNKELFKKFLNKNYILIITDKDYAKMTFLLFLSCIPIFNLIEAFYLLNKILILKWKNNKEKIKKSACDEVI